MARADAAEAAARAAEAARREAEVRLEELQRQLEYVDRLRQEGGQGMAAQLEELSQRVGLGLFLGCDGSAACRGWQGREAAGSLNFVLPYKAAGRATTCVAPSPLLPWLAA